MTIHIGKRIRAEVNRSNLSIVDFGKKIRRSRNVVYDIFERETIDTGLLQKISKVLNYDFFSVYSKYNFPEAKSVNTETEALLKEIAYLKRINSLLEGGKDSLNENVILSITQKP